MANPKISINNIDIISIRGNDAEKFLQGQLTNNIEIIKDENKAIYSGYCTPKGRLIAFFLIIKIWDNYFLFCPTSISAEIGKKLSMYIMRSDVQLSYSEAISYFYFYANTKVEEEFKKIWGDVPYPTKLMEKSRIRDFFFDKKWNLI